MDRGEKEEEEKGLRERKGRERGHGGGDRGKGGGGEEGLRERM